MSDATFTGASNYNRTVYGTWDLSFKEIAKKAGGHFTPEDSRLARSDGYGSSHSGPRRFVGSNWIVDGVRLMEEGLILSVFFGVSVREMTNRFLALYLQT